MIDLVFWLTQGWCGIKGRAMVRRRRNARRFTDPLCPCGCYLRPPQGHDVRLPKILDLGWGDTVERAVIGSLTKTRRRTKTGSRLRQSDWVVIVLQQGGTVTLLSGAARNVGFVRNWDRSRIRTVGNIFCTFSLCFCVNNCGTLHVRY